MRTFGTPTFGLLLTLMTVGLHAGEADVAIDVGHSLALPGATSARGRGEFQFNRDLALAIDEAVHAGGMTTRIIGSDGEQASLGSRAVRARGTRLFLSVHHDSVQPHFLMPWIYEGEERLYSDRYAGFSLFVSRRNAETAKSLVCASRIGEQLRLAGFSPSLYHADPIAGEMKPFADRVNGVHYYDNLAVLKGASSPAVLMEAGVIVNRDEEQALSDPATRLRLAQAVAKGLDRCLNGAGAGRK